MHGVHCLLVQQLQLVLTQLVAQEWLHVLLPFSVGLDMAGDLAADVVRCPFEHPRFFTVELEEHHQVSGPHMTEAAALFAAGEIEGACACA